MFRSTKVLRGLAAAVVVSMAAGCAQPVPKAAPEPGGDQAGAWYQIYFEHGSSVVKDDAQVIVKSVARLVKSEGSTRVTVIGKTDRIGDPPANVALSRHRAASVRDALIAAGVPASIIVTSWTGERKPQLAKVSEIDEQANRVVDITVLKQR